MIFRGYAAVFGNVDRGGDIIIPGAFANTLWADREIPLYFNHGIAVGKPPIGVINFAKEDDYGLFVKGRIFEKNIAAVVKPDITEMSIGFRTIRFKRIQNRARRSMIRELHEVDLVEVSLIPEGLALNPKAKILEIGG